MRRDEVALRVTRLRDDEVGIAVGVIDKGSSSIMKERLPQNDIDDEGLDHIKLDKKLEVINHERDVGSQAQDSEVRAC